MGAVVVVTRAGVWLLGRWVGRRVGEEEARGAADAAGALVGRWVGEEEALGAGGGVSTIACAEVCATRSVRSGAPRAVVAT